MRRSAPPGELGTNVSASPVPPAAPAQSAPRRRRSVLRVVLWIVIPLLLLAGLGYWNALRVAEATLARHREKSAQEQRALSARTYGRPALLEPLGEGTAEMIATRFAEAVARIPEADLSRLPGFLDDETEAGPPEEQDRILTAHPEALVALGLILHVPSAAPSPRLDVDAATAELVPARRRGSQWVDAHVRRAIAEASGQGHSKALRLTGEHLALGADLERRATLIALLGGVDIQRRALSRMSGILGTGAVDLEAIRSLIDVLSGLEGARPLLQDVAAVERATMRRLFSVPRMDIDDGLRKVGWRRLWSGKVFRAESMDDLDRFMDRVGEILRVLATEPARARTELAELSRQCQEAPNLGRMGIPLWGVALGSVLQRDALWRVARTSLAVCLHAAEHGSPPASLEALVPRYLHAVPVDPWDGRPLRYAPGPPARVWSIGRDGQDDGGTPSPGPETGREPGDVAITIGSAR